MATTTTPDALERRNKWTFGIGTIGRDMVYTLVSMFMVFFLSEVLDVSDTVLLWVSWLVLGARLFDAVMDVVMGSIVDNTHSRWGHYKPWILVGVLCSAVFTVLLFADLGLDDQTFIVVFAVVYLLWGLSWTMNDIPYWAMLPALSVDQKVRERIGSVAKIFANIGLLVVAVAVIPVTNALGAAVGLPRAWLLFTAGICVIMVAGQFVTLFGVKEPHLAAEQQHTSLREVAGVVFKNDQLLWTSIAMVIFMTGYLTTTTFGTYFFKYAYGDEEMYSPFAAVLIFSQLIAFITFPMLRKRFNRRPIFTVSIVLLLVGYLAFFFAPMSILAIGACGLLLFIGQGYITMLMLVFLTDTIDYGHWKLGRRNVGVTFALQPFINKVGAALSTQIVAVTIVAAGISSAHTPADVTADGLMLMKVVMLIVPAVLILVSYLLYRWKYRIDEQFHARIIADLRERGQLQSDG
ncbi:MAG: glycoside-pentoside-hexuronide (GPH):cation symporter [Propionicimonas sp.]|nr:glycoside-pentoside-hexuronide (GPH):cation symporter [Propionicimonas sp.]